MKVETLRHSCASTVIPLFPPGSLANTRRDAKRDDHAIHPADRGCAWRQRVRLGRNRRRISIRLAVDDCSERRNICVRARAARAQSTRCTKWYFKWL